MSYQLYHGDCIEVMRGMDGGSVQCVVTSPPYFGLRDYGEPHQLGLEDKPDCLGWATGDPCGECYVCHMVGVFREVWRVLADDGEVWLNLGDSYARPAAKGGSGPGGKNRAFYGDNYGAANKADIPDGLKQKDLIGIPWRVALALQADGWILRQDVVWAKPNPMPESVRDRCTKAHEYIFLLAKQPKYYYDHEAVKEDATGRPPGNSKATKGGRAHEEGDEKHRTAANLHKIEAKEKRNRRSVWWVPSRPFKEAHFAVYPPDLIEPCILAGSRPGDTVLDPFSGAGTTGVVAMQNEREYVGIDANADYLEISERRIQEQAEEGDKQSDLFGDGGVA